jgi:hypothetical protein
VKLIILLLAIIIPNRGLADGLSYLGMCHPTWSCKETLNNWRYEPLGWLENTFGARCQCVDRFLAKPEPKVIRAHLINSPCMRNKRCGRYEVLYKETAASASRKIVRGDKAILKKFNTVLNRFRERIGKAKGDVKCYISSCLECDLYESARKVLADLVFAAVPNCTIVDNPYRRKCLSGYVCEGHGENPRLTAPCIADLDGTDALDVNLNKWLAKYSHCDIRFVWSSWMNCLSDKFVDPRKRNC